MYIYCKVCRLCTVQLYTPRIPPHPQLNMYLLLFNLFLPAYPLDGGRILVDALLLLGLPELPTALVTVVLGTLSGLGLCIWAFIATRLMAALVCVLWSVLLCGWYCCMGCIAIYIIL